MRFKHSVAARCPTEIDGCTFDGWTDVNQISARHLVWSGSAQTLMCFRLGLDRACVQQQTAVTEVEISSRTHKTSLLSLLALSHKYRTALFSPPSFSSSSFSFLLSSSLTFLFLTSLLFQSHPPPPPSPSMVLATARRRDAHSG
jgi:hypothetical protein